MRACGTNEKKFTKYVTTSTVFCCTLDITRIANLNFREPERPAASADDPGGGGGLGDSDDDSDLDLDISVDIMALSGDARREINKVRVARWL